MLDRAMIIVKQLVEISKKIPVIGWLIRTAEWVWEGVGYLLDERKDRQKYGRPLRFWMIWRRLGRELTVAVREGAERERNRKQGKRWGWIRGVRWIDKGVRGAEDRRERWLHEGQVDEPLVGIDWGMEKPEIVIMSTGLNKPLTDEEMIEAEVRAENQTYVSQFMESYGKLEQQENKTYRTRLG